MKHIIIVLVFLFSFAVFSQNTQYQRYNVESGKVTYKTETKKETIIKSIIFKNWGATELITETEITFKSKKKKKVVKEITKIIKLDNALIFSVDEEDKKIIQMKNYGLVLFKNKNLTNEGKRISKANGGREVEHETILGYDCEVWKLKGTTTVMYKGVPLKTIARKTEIATKAEFDISVTDKDITLPNYPIINANPWQDQEDAVNYYSTEEGQQEVLDASVDAWENVQDLTWEEWYILHGEDEEFEDLTQEEIKELYNQQIKNRVDNRVNDHINNRINNRLNNKINRKIPKPRNPRKIRPW